MENAKNNKAPKKFTLNNHVSMYHLFVGLPLVIIFVCLNLQASAKNLNFTRHVYPPGLTQNSINDIIQDQEGLIWLATRGGIHYYDGIRYSRLGLNSNSEVSTALYESVFEDSQQYLWFGGYQGEVYRYNKFSGDLSDYSNLFRTFAEAHDNLEFSGQVFVFCQISENQIWIGSEGGVIGFDLKTLEPFAISELSNFHQIKGITDIRKHKQTIWLATASGLLGINTSNGKILNFVNNPLDFNSLSENRISKLLPTEQALWIGTYNGGLNRMDYADFRFTRYNASAEPAFKITAGRVNDIILDDKGHVWVAQQAGGLHRYDLDEKRFIRFQKHKGDNYSLSSNDIASLYQDKTGLVWIGTSNAGVNQYSETTNKFKQLKSKLNNKNSLSDDFVWDISLGPDGNIWLATLNGLDKYNALTGEFEAFKIPKSIDSNNQVISLDWSAHNTLWLGLSNGELFEFDPKSQTFSAIVQPQFIDRFSERRILHVFKDRSSYLWIATYEGSYRLAPEQQLDAAENSANYQLQNKAITRVIHHDNLGRFWLGTNGQGLFLYDQELNFLKNFVSQKNMTNSLSDSVIRSIYEDQFGDLWIGTGAGLNKLSRGDVVSANNNFKRYKIDNGIKNDIVYSIQPGRSNELWLATNLGLVQLDTASEQYLTYQVSDGISANEFNGDASIKSLNGELFFGSVSGVTYFDPLALKVNSSEPSVVIRDIKVDGERSAQGVSYDKIKQAHVFAGQSEIEVEFASMDYHQPSKNRYRYRLLPFQTEWSSESNKSKVVFAHLSPGEYQLELMASNNSANWSTNTRRLSIIVHPPWWQSRYAYFSYILLAIFMSFLFVRKQQKKLREEKEISAKLSRLNRLKDEFLANTSHEFRTPLNGIVGLSEVLIETEKLSEDARQMLRLINTSGQRLAELVNDILDDASLNNGKLVLEYQEFLLEPILNSELQSLEFNTKDSVELDYQMEDPTLKLTADPKRVKQIIHNLVGNAIKFTSEGKVLVKICKDGNRNRIEVSDTGIGIPQEKLENIFDDFSQVDGSTKREYGGVGLGLSITKKLVELHHGEITVDSQLGEGSRFIVWLP